MKLTKEMIDKARESLENLIDSAGASGYDTEACVIEGQAYINRLCEAAVEPDSLVGRRVRVGKRTGTIKSAYETFSIDFGGMVTHVFREDCELIDEGED